MAGLCRCSAPAQVPAANSRFDYPSWTCRREKVPLRRDACVDLTHDPQPAPLQARDVSLRRIGSRTEQKERYDTGNVGNRSGNGVDVRHLALPLQAPACGLAVSCAARKAARGSQIARGLYVDVPLSELIARIVRVNICRRGGHHAAQHSVFAGIRRQGK